MKKKKAKKVPARNPREARRIALRVEIVDDIRSAMAALEFIRYHSSVAKQRKDSER